MKVKNVPILKVNVTSVHIKRGSARNAHRSVVVEALKEQYPHMRFVVETGVTIGMTDVKAGYRYLYIPPAAALRNMINYDLGKVVRPYSFTLRTGIAKPVRKSARG